MVILKRSPDLWQKKCTTQGLPQSWECPAGLRSTKMILSQLPIRFELRRCYLTICGCSQSVLLTQLAVQIQSI